LLLLDNEKRTYFCLIGAYANLDKEAKDKARRKGLRSQHKLDSVIDDMIEERKGDDKIKDLFHRLDLNGDGFLDKNEFILAYKRLNPDVCAAQLEAMFEEADVDDSGTLDLKEVRCPSVDDGTRQIRLTFLQFMAMVKLPQVDVLGKLSVVNRDSRGLVQVNPSNERFFGEELQSQAPSGVGAFLLSESQHLAMELYESRVASMQRYVAMCVMFHQMGMRVQSFFPKISFGLLGYRMDRTHSSKRQSLVVDRCASRSNTGMFSQRSHENRNNCKPCFRRQREGKNGRAAPEIQDPEGCQPCWPALP